MHLVQGYKSFPFFNLVNYQAHGNSFQVTDLETEIVGEKLIKEALSFDRKVNTYVNRHKYSVLEPSFLEKTFDLLDDSYYYELLLEAYYDYRREWKGYKDHKIYFELCLAQIWYVINWREKLSFPVELVFKYKLK